MSRIPYEIDLWFRINEEVLWAIDRSVEELPFHILKHNLDIPYFESIGTDDWNLTPRMLIDNFDKEMPHATTVNNADISFPIEIYYFRDQWIILDGVHRFTKLSMNKAATIKVRKVTDEIMPLIKKTPEEFKKRKWEI